MKMRLIYAAVVLASLAGLTACGDDPGTRALTGGAIGAGGGAAIGAMTGHPGTGAIIGGAAGAVGGAATTPEHRDYGYYRDRDYEYGY